MIKPNTAPKQPQKWEKKSGSLWGKSTNTGGGNAKEDTEIGANGASKSVGQKKKEDPKEKSRAQKRKRTSPADC